MNILIFEYHNFGIEDVKETFTKNGHKYKAIESALIKERKSTEFDSIFEKAYEEGINGRPYDCVFTFIYSPVISVNCNKVNLPYIAWVYDSPHVALYSYTLINPCNHVFIFDKMQYLELKNAGIDTVYYEPLAVNIDRMKRMLDSKNDKNAQIAEQLKKTQSCDISFVGAMYNEKHNLFKRLEGISDYTRGYLESIMKAQRKVYGYYFLQEMLTPQIIADMQKACPLEPSPDGVETIQYLYADYFMARQMASDERIETLKLLGEKLGSQYKINLYTHNATPELEKINNIGAIDYYDTMPYIFRNSRINLNITMRSIKSGIPLRGMDICAAGGFLLSNYQEDMYDIFVPGEDVVLYESQDDLLAKCRYYLTHEAERQQIAANGYGKVAEKCSYDVRLEEMFAEVFGAIGNKSKNI